jgi:hypothetical protein
MAKPSEQNLKTMKEKILKGWTFQRWLYLILGGFVAIQAVAEQRWLALIPGGYFVSMAIFNFGCAAGCFGGTCSAENHPFKKETPETNLTETNK